MVAYLLHNYQCRSFFNYPMSSLFEWCISKDLGEVVKPLLPVQHMWSNISISYFCQWVESAWVRVSQFSKCRLSDGIWFSWKLKIYSSVSLTVCLVLDCWIYNMDTKDLPVEWLIERVMFNVSEKCEASSSVYFWWKEFVREKTSSTKIVRRRELFRSIKPAYNVYIVFLREDKKSNDLIGSFEAIKIRSVSFIMNEWRIASARTTWIKMYCVLIAVLIAHSIS